LEASFAPSERINKVRRGIAGYRRKLATILVALYAFCAVAPHAALALAHAGNAIHCFTETGTSPHQHEHVTNNTHVHEDGAMHSHDQAANTGTGDEDKSAQTACCSLFSVSAITTEMPAAIHVQVVSEKIAVLPQSDLADHPPRRLIRPPII
jgi:hypothetical protein